MLTMAAGFSVQIDDLRAATAAFAQLRTDGAGVLGAGGLGDTGGMAGRDPVLAEWRARYDAMAAAQWAASTTAVSTLGAIATKLSNTADTYLGAEHDARARFGRRPATPPEGAAGDAERVGTSGAAGPPPSTGPGGPDESATAGPPPSTGPGGPDVPDVLAEYFPGGDPERLRAAAAYWSTLSDGMGRIANTGDAAFRRLTDTGDGAAFSAMRTFWATRFTPCATDPLFNAVVNGAAMLRDACGALADLIEHTRAAVRRAAAEAVEDMAPLELPAKLLGKLAWNIPELELLIGRARSPSPTSTTPATPTASPSTGCVEHLRPETSSTSAGWPCRPPRMRRSGWASPTSARSRGLELTGTAWDTAAGPHPTPDAIHVTPQQVTHIITGDRSGGGHAPGRRDPRQDRVPPRMDRRAIVAAALSVARDPAVRAAQRCPGTVGGHRRPRRDPDQGDRCAIAVHWYGRSPRGAGRRPQPEVGDQPWISFGSRPQRRSCSTAWVTGCRTKPGTSCAPCCGG